MKSCHHLQRGIFGLLAFLSIAIPAQAQQEGSSDSVRSMTLDDCIDYALKHQPYINQAQINVSITRANNAINLAGWLPQVNVSANALHYNQLPTSFTPNTDSTGPATIPTHNGISNTFIPELTASQTIFNPQLLFAAKSAPLYVKQSEQIRDSMKIYIISLVSKSFYNLLLTLEQIHVLKEDTARLDRNVMDTYHQFVGGIVDETDYDEAVITLNNSKAQLRQSTENITPLYATLKQTMGFPPRRQFNVAFDTAQMIREIAFDTTQQLQFDRRIEFQELQTTKRIQHIATNYYALAFLPTISVEYNYFYEYENSHASDLFGSAYPYSYFGLGLNIPIFTGFARTNNLRKSRLQERYYDWEEVALRSDIYTQYTTALANYKGNLYNWQLLKDNVSRAENAYRIVTLQYKEGIVAYLNVIVAESNLITAQIGYINALFQLLSSRIDLQKSLGDISINR